MPREALHRHSDARSGRIEDLREEMEVAVGQMSAAASQWLAAFVDGNSAVVEKSDAWHAEVLRNYRRAERKLRKLQKQEDTPCAT